MKLPWPITSDYAAHQARNDPGIDLGTPQGTDLFAPSGDWEVAASLYVTREDGSPSYGSFCVISNGKLELGFAHLSERIYHKGVKLKPGRKFAATGGTPGTPGAGNSSGAHVHVRAKRNGVLIDPTDLPELLEVFEVAQFTEQEAKLLKGLILQASDAGKRPGELVDELVTLGKKVKRLEDATPAGAHRHTAKVILD